MNIQRVISVLVLGSMALAFAPATFAQEGAESGGPETLEEVVAVGIRGSLATALEAKRSSDNLVEAIFAEDVGKLPDQNLAEVLENITGVQINRAAGVGTGVQIRGTSSNRVEINGVSTMGSGDGRGGISFDDVSASIISSVEVTKSPTAKTIEGSVGGTINLRTARPLNLSERVAHVRLQGEYSDLDLDGGTLPRISGTFGDNWSNDSGDFGILLSASYAEQDVTAFRPRVDRDALVLPTQGHGSVEDFPFMRIQFLNQVYNNYEYETANFSGTFEWAPSDNTKFWIDTTINDQQRGAQNYSAPLSGTTDAINVSNTVNEMFETVDFGSLVGEGGSTPLPTVQAVTTGYMPYNPSTPTDDPNLRSSTNTNTRETTSEIFTLGGEWVGERLTATAEASLSQSDTASPSLGVQLDFLNPHTAQPGDPGVGGVDNATPAIFDIRGGVLQFGLLEGTPFSPSIAELLDPFHWKLRQISQSRNVAENSETAFRTDFTYNLDWNAFTTFDFGYRFAERSNSSLNVGRTSRYNNIRTTANRPRGDLFSDILIPGPDNFNAADGRSLYIRDFLQVDPALSYSNPDAVVSSLNAAIAAANAANNDTMPLHDAIAPDDTTFFDADESTHALYAQANFATGIFRGNAGLRFVETTFSAQANSDQNGVIVSESRLQPTMVVARTIPSRQVIHCWCLKRLSHLTFPGNGISRQGAWSV